MSFTWKRGREEEERRASSTWHMSERHGMGAPGGSFPAYASIAFSPHDGWTEAVVQALDTARLGEALSPLLTERWLSRSSLLSPKRLTQEYEAFRIRDLSGYEVAYLFMDAVYEPLRRWGSKTEALCV
jgi:hypothetical protein